MSLLNLHDTQTACWTKLKGHYEAELVKARARVENPTTEERERLALCWKIHMMKDFLSHGEQAQKKNVTGAG